MPLNDKPQNWDPQWEILFKNQSWGEFPTEALVRHVANTYKKLKRPLKILEIGCGPGSNLSLYYKYCDYFEGLDASQTALHICEQKVKESPIDLNCCFICADLYDFKEIEIHHKFDIVVDVECLYCIEEETAQKIILKLQDLLHEGGTIFSMMFSNNTEYSSLREMTGTTTRSLEEVKSLFPKDSNLSIEKCSRTSNNMQILTEEFIIVCQKSA